VPLYYAVKLSPSRFCRPLASSVSIEGHDPPSALQAKVIKSLVLLFGERRPHRGDRVREAGLVHGDRVEVPLHDDRRPLFADGGPRDVQGVERRALVEERRLRRIHVFPGLVRTHRPTAEGDDPAATVLDRHHEPVPEPVIRSVLTRAHEPGRDGLLLREALLPEIRKEPVELIRRVAEPEPLHGLGLDAPSADIGRDRLSRRRPPEGLAEIEVGGVVRREQTLLALLLLRRAPARELDAGPLGERPQGLGGRKAVLLLEPGEDVALLATAKTVVGTPVGIDVE